MNHLPINEIIALLEDYAPGDLVRLRKEFPENEQLFQSGQTLGDSNDKTFSAKLSACIAGLKLIIEKCKELMPKIKRRIEHISRLQLISQIVVAVSGAAIISTLQQDGINWLKYISSVLVLMGSVIGIYVQHTSNSVYNNSSLFSNYATLQENYLLAEQQLLDLEMLTQGNPEDEATKTEVKYIIQQANATSIQIRKIISHHS